MTPSRSTVSIRERDEVFPNDIVQHFYEQVRNLLDPFFHWHSDAVEENGTVRVTYEVLVAAGLFNGQHLVTVLISDDPLTFRVSAGIVPNEVGVDQTGLGSFWSDSVKTTRLYGVPPAALKQVLKVSLSEFASKLQIKP